jgi:hypothetical protein
MKLPSWHVPWSRPDGPGNGQFPSRSWYSCAALRVSAAPAPAPHEAVMKALMTQDTNDTDEEE